MKKITKFLRWFKKHKIITLILIAGGVYYFTFANKAEQKQSPVFATVEILRGDLKHVVTATGEIQPVNTVNIGSQVSGTIEKIFFMFYIKIL